MRMTLNDVRRWPHNDYEGELTLIVGGFRVLARVVASEVEWRRLKVGALVEGRLIFLRYGAWRVVAPGFSLDLTDAARVTLRGTVGAVEGEQLAIVEAPWMSVDLDTDDAMLSEVSTGQGIFVEGRFEFELDDLL